MRNEVIFDKNGIPDIMVAFTPDELGLPAELKGRKVEAYLIGKYPATMIDGVPHSLPFQKPAVDVNHDEAIRLCEAKGPGWHLTTNDEWAALAHQSRKNGTLPRGNTNSGKSHSHPEETGTTYEGGYGKTLTGSGPVTWNHDHTAEGVADMCGNVWEHVGGIRFVDGKVQVIPRNEAAAGADQSKDSPEWVNIYTADGDPIYYEVTDDEIWLRATEPEDKDYCGVSFTDLEPGEVDNLDELIRLGLYPADGYEGSDYFWLDTNGERCVSRGGDWYAGAGAGVFYLSGHFARSNSHTGMIDFLTYEDTYTEVDGSVKPFIPAGKIAACAPAAGRTVYGAITQVEQSDGEFHTYTGVDVPKYLSDATHNVRELILSSAPLCMPNNENPFIVADVLGE